MKHACTGSRGWMPMAGGKLEAERLVSNLRNLAQIMKLAVCFSSGSAVKNLPARLPLEMSPGREAACRAVFGTWVFFRTMHGKTAPSC